MNSKKHTILVAGLLGVLSAILCFASVANYAYPGESAHLIALWRGLDIGEVEYPLMAFFAKLLGGGNLIAPVCGTIAAFALYVLASSMTALRVKEDEAQPNARWRLAMVSGAVTTLVFLLTPCVRSAATHLEPRLFDFTWALVTLLCAVPFFRAPADGAKASAGPVKLLAAVFGLFCGLAFCDSALVFAFLPIYVAVLVGAALKRKVKPYAALVLFLFVGVATCVVSAKLFGLDISKHLVALAREARAWVSIPGWIFVAAFATLPFLVAVFSSRRAFNERPSLVVWLFHASLTFAVILAVATPLSPSALMEPYGVLPVASSAFAAVVAGYLAAFWWHNRRAVVALVVGGVLVFALAATCLWNLFTFDGRRGAFADQVARKVLKDLGARQWLVTDGVLDDHLRLVAQEEGKDVHLVSLVRDADDAYRAQLSALVAEKNLGGAKNAELRASLTLGVLPFIEDWLASDPEAKKSVAVWGAPDLWLSARVTPVPEFLFFGGDEANVPDWTDWKVFDKILSAPKAWGSYSIGKVANPVDRLRLSLRRHVGFVANNRGVWLQDQHRDDDAWKMYELVLTDIDRDNICTIFNEMAMMDAKHPAAVAKKRDLERLLKAAVEDTNRRYVLWRLGSYYGYIRNPDLFIRLGHVWARSGRPGEALTQIRRAIDFVPTEKRTSLLNMMAALYASEQDQKKSRRIYEAVLAKDAEDHDALIGLMRLELAAGRPAKAVAYLERAVAVAGDDKRANVERAMLAMMKQDYAGAAASAQKAIDKDVNDLQSWSILASITLQQMRETKDAKAKAVLEKKLEGEIIPSMEKHATDSHDYHLQTTKGFALLQKGDDRRQEARDAFALAARSRPDVAATQDLVLGLDISLADREHAERQAKEVLRRNRNAPLANYVMGSLAFGRGDLGNAELFLRRAADAPQPVALAQNDLAEICRRAKRFDEAEAYARKAVAAAPGLYVAWETLGSILMDKGGDLTEAEACVRKACDLSKTKDGQEADVRMLVSLARVQLKIGDKQHAKVTVRKVQRRLNELSDFEKKEFEQIAKDAK